MKRRYTIIVGIGISLLLLVLVLRGVDLNRVQGALAGADYRYVVPAVLLLVAGLFTRAIRWRVLLLARLSLKHAFSILNVSYLFNSALPFRLGEVVRIFLATRVPEPVAAFTTLSTILVERLVDLLTVIGMLGIVLTMLDVPDYVTTAGIVLGAGSVFGLAVLVTLARRQELAFSLLAWVKQLVPVIKRWNLEVGLARFLEGLQPLASGQVVFHLVFWTAVSWGLSVVAGYVLLYAFFPRPEWVTTLFFIVMASLAVSVPYAPGAVGPYEAGVVVALSLTGFGQPDGAAIAFAIVLHVVNVGIYTVMGVLGLLHQGMSLGQVMRGAQGMDSSQVAAPVRGSTE